MPTPFSKFPEALMVVEESVHYPVLGPASDKEWFSVTSSSYRYIRLGPEHRLFHAAMAHELHCLRMLNLAFGNTSFPDTGHIQHCLNRIRQSILCDSDLTLEPGNFEERDFTLERVGATHVCQDWAILYDIMDENTISWLNATQVRTFHLSRIRTDVNFKLSPAYLVNVILFSYGPDGSALRLHTQPSNPYMYESYPTPLSPVPT